MCVVRAAGGERDGDVRVACVSLARMLCSGEKTKIIGSDLSVAVAVACFVAVASDGTVPQRSISRVGGGEWMG